MAQGAAAFVANLNCPSCAPPRVDYSPAPWTGTADGSPLHLGSQP